MEIQDREVHPAAEMFPLMSDEELDELAADIKEKGLHNPILLLDGMVVDGRNRLLACEKAGVMPQFSLAPILGDPYAWVWSTNSVRRHLTPGQRAAIKVKQLEASEEWEREQVERKREANRARSEGMKGKKNAAKSKPKNSGAHRWAPPIEPTKPAKKKGSCKASKAIAKEIGVGKSTVECAQQVARESPELLDEVASGKRSLRSAAEEVKQRDEPDPITRFEVLMPQSLRGRIQDYATKKGIGLSAAMIDLVEKALSLS